MQLTLVSNNRPPEEAVHPRMRGIVDRVEYLSEVGKGEILKAHWNALKRHPFRYLRACLAMFLVEEKLKVTLAQFTGAVLVFKRHCHNGDPLPSVHAHFTYGAASVAMWLSRLAGVPYSLTLHGSDLNFDQPADLKSKLLEADALVSISEFNHKYLRQNYPESNWDNVSVIPLGAMPRPNDDLSSQASQIGALVERSEPLRILTVGRLSEHKAQHLLIEACQRLSEQGLEYECSIVGDGPLRSDLAAQISAAGIEDKVKLLGPRYHHEVLELYRMADLFVLSSVAEGMPMVLMEAMQARVPVVAPSLSGIPELLAQGTAGLLVEPGSADALADVLVCCAKGSVDLNSIADKALEHVSTNFDMKCNALRFKRFLEEAR